MSFQKIVSLVLGMFWKMTELVQSIYGWGLAACVFVVNFFSGYETAITAVVVCVALDTLWGVWAQVKRGHFILSELGRHGMLSKWALYASVIICFILIERMAGMTSQLTVIVVCSLICLVELWSMSGSALIVNPQMPFLRLFRRALTGEIARKMDATPAEVREFLEQQNNSES